MTNQPKNQPSDNKRTLEYIGTDDWSRPVYKCLENGVLWKDIELGDSEIPSLYSCSNDFDGEPCSGINPELELHFASKPPSKENRFNYMMLSRLQADCEYYLGYGNRSTNRLYYEEEQKHIDEMKRIHNELPEDGKPEWLTMEQIEEYEKQMTTQVEKFKINSEFIEEAFKGYEVPEKIKATSIKICEEFNIKGICDPMYISNVIAVELGIGEGNSVFYDKEPDLSKVAYLSQRLMGAFGCNIKDVGLLRNIITNGFVSE